jgi:hypothetical protein
MRNRIQPALLFGRRQFLASAALVPGITVFSLAPRATPEGSAAQPNRLLFTSQGKTALVNADGSGSERTIRAGSDIHAAPTLLSSQ